VHLYDVPIIFVLIGLALYVVLGGADFGAGLWQLATLPAQRGGPRRASEPSASASTPITRWVPSGRPTTCG
jgi:hypothetical protein